MNKKGFTLVEMLAVVIIMGLILLLVIPQIQNQISNRKESIHESTLEMIYTAVDDFTSSDPSTFQKIYNDDGNRAVYCISLQELVNAGKLEAPIKNFTNGEELDLAYIIKAVTNQFNEFEYTLTESATCDFDIEPIKVYYDPALPANGDTYPTLYPGMIPVIYENGHWVKASMYKVWYNYASGKGMWANAVTVNATASQCKEDCVDTLRKHGRTYYENARVGEAISMDDINGMYVWIPKFEYKVSGWGTGTGLSAASPGSIDVKYVAKDTTTPTSGYTIHPAFKFGDRQIGGMWVAKFEASPNQGSNCYISAEASNCNKSYESKKNEPKLYVSVTPNQNSWRYISIGNAYDAVSRMNVATSFNGLKSTAVDTHLMKNTEWGAVAYLAQSIYGIYGVNSNPLEKEIFPNKYFNNATLTGCTLGKSGNNLSTITACQDSSSNKLNYNYAATYRGTTSGTIYGIFDMAGGAWEYVMGNFNRNEASGNILLNDVYKENFYA